MIVTSTLDEQLKVGKWLIWAQSLEGTPASQSMANLALGVLALLPHSLCLAKQNKNLSGSYRAFPPLGKVRIPEQVGGECTDKRGTGSLGGHTA